MHRTNWSIDHGLKYILEARKDQFRGQGHKGLHEILTTSWHTQLSLSNMIAQNQHYSKCHFLKIHSLKASPTLRHFLLQSRNSAQSQLKTKKIQTLSQIVVQLNFVPQLAQDFAQAMFSCDHPQFSLEMSPPKKNGSSQISLSYRNPSLTV